VSQASAVWPMAIRCLVMEAKWDEAKRMAQHAVHMAPWQLDSWFNLAQIAKEQATRLMALENTSSSLLETVVIPNLKFVAPLFRYLHSAGSAANSRRHFSTNKCERMAQMCEGNLEQAQVRLESVKTLEADRESKRAQRRRDAQALFDESQRKEMEKLEMEAARRRELDQKAEEMQMKRIELEKAWREETEKKKSKTKDDDNNIIATEDDANLQETTDEAPASPKKEKSKVHNTKP